MDRRDFLRGSAAAATAMAASGSLAQPSAAQGGKQTFAFFVKNVTNPNWKYARIGAEKAAKELGVTLEHVAPTKPDNIEEQTRLVEDWIVKKPTGFVFVPVDFKALVPSVQKAVDAKNNDLGMQLLDAIVEIKPDYVEAWNRRATLHFMNKHYGEAVADLRQVLAREPRHFGAEPGKVEPRSEYAHHFNSAAGGSERHRPEAVLSSPVGERLYGSRYEAVAAEERIRIYSHSSAPFFTI